MTHRLPRRTCLSLLAALSTSLLALPLAQAQAQAPAPGSTVRLLVGYAAGGPMDAMARI